MDTIINPSTIIVSESDGAGVDFTVQLITSGDLSLAGFYGKEGLSKKPDLAQALFVHFFSMGAQRVYAPTPVEFNGKVISPKAFTTQMMLSGLGGSVEMLRIKEYPADGTLLRSIGDAGTFSGAGCPMAVATYKRHMVFAHAGRDCLLDRVRVDSFDEQQGRRFPSVVTSIVEALKEESRESEDFNPGKVRAWVYGSIRPEDFTHPLNDPKYDIYNGKMYGYVKRRFGPECVGIKDNAVQLDLPVLIRRQFMGLGVPEDRVSLTHAYLPSHFPTTRGGNGKYLAVALRTS